MYTKVNKFINEINTGHYNTVELTQWCPFDQKSKKRIVKLNDRNIKKLSSFIYLIDRYKMAVEYYETLRMISIRIDSVFYKEGNNE